MASERINDAGGLVIGVTISSKHSIQEPLLDHLFGPLDGLLALAKKGRRVLAENWLPQPEAIRVSGKISLRSLELFDDSVGWNSTELRIDRSETGMLTHDDFVASGLSLSW